MRYRKLRIGVLVVKWLVLGGLVIGPGLASFAQGWRARTAPQGPLAGEWEVSRFAGKGTPWTKAVVIEYPGNTMLILRDGGGKEWRAFVEDDKRGTLRLKGKDGSERKWTYRLSMPDGLSVREGPTLAEFRRDTKVYPLVRHRIHWIQAQPRTP